MTFTVCIRWCLEIVFTGWVCLCFFRQTASRCPSFWQYQHTTSLKGQSTDLWSVFPHRGQVPFGKSLSLLWTWCIGCSPESGEGDRLLESTLQTALAFVPYTHAVSFATLAASSVSIATAIALAKVSSSSLNLKSAFRTASLLTEYMNWVRIASVQRVLNGREIALITAS